MAPHSSTLAWKIPQTEGPGRLQSMGSLESDTTERLHFHFSLSCIGEGNGNPLQCSCLENPRDRGAWWAAVYGVAQSWTRLKRLSSSGSYILPISLHEGNFNLVTLFSLPSSSSPSLFQSIKSKIFKLILSRNFHHACRVSCSWPHFVVFIPWYFTSRFL